MQLFLCPAGISCWAHCCAVSENVVTDTHTHTQTTYSNPHAGTPRVNKRIIVIIIGHNLQILVHVQLVRVLIDHAVSPFSTSVAS